MTEKQRLKHEQQAQDAKLTKPSRFDAVGLALAGFVEPRTPPRLAWINARTSSRFDDRRHASGRKSELTEAVSEHAGRILAAEIQKAIQKAEEKTDDTGSNLPDNQREVPVVAAGTTEA